MSIHQLIDSLKEKGYEVYGPEKLTSYAYFTDGTHIGYVQYNPVGGTKYTTVHMPCTQCGTGFEARSAEEALAFAPGWAYKQDTDFVVKYRDFEHFKAKNWQPLVQY